MRRSARYPLRVAVDATPLLDEKTGVGTFTQEVLERLAPHGDLEVTGYATSWRGRDRLAETLPPGVRAPTRPMPARPLRAAWRRVDGPPIEWWTGPVDLVHGTNFVVPPVRRAATLVTIHDLTAVRFPELCTADTLQYPALISRALDRGAHVHTVSPYVAAEVREHFGLSADRVTAIENGVSPIVETEPGEGCRLAGGDRYVLALGTVEPRKDLPLLVRAFDQVAGADPAVRLVIAGPDGWGSDALGAELGRARHPDRIRRLRRFVTEQERAALLRDAVAFAYPSRYEGFGLPPLEALSVGTPVVATDAGALPDVLGDAALLTAVGDSEALAESLTVLLTDPGRGPALVAAGRRRLERYTWDRTAQGLIGLYRRLVA